MKLYDIGTRKQLVSLEQALLEGLAADGSLYMPTEIPRFSKKWIQEIDRFSFQELSFELAKALIGEDVPHDVLRRITEVAFNFPVPLRFFNTDTAILELFHGPSMAFKDFGARFMAGLMSYFLKKRNAERHILVATSGDTGGAVAAGFYGVENIRVSILYPSGKVSPLQEKQLTSWGKNITALEVKGTFDDCQAMVKKAFKDKDLAGLRLSSANSINIARLIPQSFYYFEAFRQMDREQRKGTIFSVPSGNFGNLTAGLMAKHMGLPVHYFLAATNINRIVPDYLNSGVFAPKPSIATLSNAMDVGNPSNFSRIQELYGSTWNKQKAAPSTEKEEKSSTWNKIKLDVKGHSFTDKETLQEIKTFYEKHQYLLDPHTCIAMLAWEKEKKKKDAYTGIILSTAHPAKFPKTIHKAVGISPKIPPKLQEIAKKHKQSTAIDPNYEALKDYLLKG